MNRNHSKDNLSQNLSFGVANPNYNNNHYNNKEKSLKPNNYTEYMFDNEIDRKSSHNNEHMPESKMSGNTSSKWRNTVESDLELKKSNALSAKLNLKLGGMNELFNKLKTDENEYSDSHRSSLDYRFNTNTT